MPARCHLASQEVDQGGHIIWSPGAVTEKKFPFLFLRLAPGGIMKFSKVPYSPINFKVLYYFF